MSLQKLVDQLEVLKAEYEKFERGNKSAGTRARKSLQNIKKISPGNTHPDPGNQTEGRIGVAYYLCRFRRRSSPR